jgi:hypothetical protein
MTTKRATATADPYGMTTKRATATAAAKTTTTAAPKATATADSLNFDLGLTDFVFNNMVI